jgi:hypothetical protein
MFIATNLHAWFSPFHIPAHSPVSYDDDFTRDERIAHPVFSLHRNFLWDLALSKLYTNSLLSTLNARAGWNNLSGQSGTNLLFTEALGDAPRARKQARFRYFFSLTHPYASAERIAHQQFHDGGCFSRLQLGPFSIFHACFDCFSLARPFWNWKNRSNSGKPPSESLGMRSMASR